MPLFKLKCWMKRLYRQGPHFQKNLAELKQSQCFSPEQIRAYQDEKLQRMINHCYRNVPYYRDLFNKLGLKPENIRTVDDLKKLPLMDKKTVNANFDKLIAKNRHNWLCYTASTSGSTGTPTRFIRDYHAINFENATIWRHWHNAGDTGKRRVSLRGDIVVPVEQDKPPFWRYNPANQELLMSGYHLSLENSTAYINKIMAFRPDILYCGPSMGYILAQFFKAHGVAYRFEAIFTSSESLDPGVAAYLEEVFGCRVYDWYGQAERVAAICQCRFGSYHVQEDYSLVEILSEGDRHELIGTHLHTYVMPLLRYRTYDYVDLTTEACPCGSAFRSVERIIGRTYGYIVTPEGSRISVTEHIPRGVGNLIEVQFYQDAADKLLLKVLTNGRFTEDNRHHLISNTRQYTSAQMEIIVEEVTHIPRGPNGKFVNIVSTLDPTALCTPEEKKELSLVR